MSDAIVVAAHADDEVLGASTILATRSTVVIFATDGTPPDVLASLSDRIGTSGTPKQMTQTREVEEAWGAHGELGARVEEYVQLGFGDQRATDNVVALGDALALAVRTHDGDVYVPAYQRGHPDHDAVYVAAQLARAAATTTGSDDPKRRWFVYALYGLDDDGRERFGWLDPTYFPGATNQGGTEAELERKARALRMFESQLPDESVLAGWLRDPVAEQHAPLPDLAAAAPLPPLRCFYEEVFSFSQFGIDPTRTTATLQAALDRLKT